MAAQVYRYRPMQVFWRELRARTLFPVVCLVSLWTLGTLGYWLIGRGEWDLLDSAFMTSITLSTVGYGDVLGIFHNNPLAMLYTMFLIVVGMGLVLYCMSVITAYLVEEGFSVLFLEQRMLNKINKLNGHYIIVGAGTLGENVVDEFNTTGIPFVVIEQDEGKLENLSHQVPSLLSINADAMQDKVLHNAGIERAAGLVACLPNDQENLYLTVTSKILNPDLKVAARASNADSREKLKRVGADRVVSTNEIGGLRLASEILRPEVVTFLETMLRERGEHRMSQLSLRSGSKLIGKTLKDSGIHENYGLLVLAASKGGVDDFQYSPHGDFTLEENMLLIVMGTNAGIARMAEDC